MIRTNLHGVDLHAHTTASDGSLSPTQLIAHAVEVGLQAIAVTDHDTIGGVAEAQEAARGLGIDVVVGVELSVEDSEGRFHLLGLDFDRDDSELTTSLLEIRSSRAARNELMGKKLTELGLPITMEDVLQEANHGDVVARPHFAQALLKKGAVTSVQDAFDRYLANGRPLYMPKAVLTPKDAISLIHRAGGVALMAHPGLVPMGSEALKARILSLHCDAGMDGIEAYYSQHSSAQTEQFLKIVQSNDMVTGAGSDFHGTPKPHVFLGNIVNGGPASPDILTAIRCRSRNRG